MREDIGKTTDNMKNQSIGDKFIKQGKKLEGLVNTKSFGAKHGARHETAKSRALNKAKGNKFPF